MRKIIFSILFCVLAAVSISSQTTTFTYQGNLKSGGSPANGDYDFEFKLFDLVSGGTQHGSTIQRLNVAVANGIFTVSLDFGAPTLPGADRFLDIAVRTAGGGAFTALSPRQKVNSAPYSVKSLNAATADSVTAGGIPAGSDNYIQNGTSEQASSNFNVSGTGTANIFNAATQYNIGGIRILSNAGSFNLFAGESAGAANTTGGSNAFFGPYAGYSNTEGFANSFFGNAAGASNTTGAGNSFFGVSTGSSNSTGFSNSFFGNAAGLLNSTGSNNSFFGISAGYSNTTGANNTLMGAGAGASNSTGANNSFFGYASGNVNTTGIYNTFFGIDSGGSNTTGDRNAFIGSVAGRSNTTGSRNSFFGTDAGFSNTTANENAYFGFEAGKNNLVGFGNAFFGSYAGRDNTSNSNAFFGHSAGIANTSGPGNAFFGASAGGMNTTGPFNAFFGGIAGQSNVNGGENAFFGNATGSSNTSGNGNAFFGRLAGADNTTGGTNSFFGFNAGRFNISGQSNTFVGGAAGDTNTLGNFNTVIGASADVGANNLSFATAIGSQAVVSSSNTVVLGRNLDTVQVPGNLNIAGNFTGNFTVPAANITGVLALSKGGTGSATQNFVDLSTAQTISGDKTFSNTLSGNVVNAATQYNLGGSRVLSIGGTNNLFAGVNAGQANPTGGGNSFFGTSAGQSNTSATANSFFGESSGYSITTGGGNSFFGWSAGYSTTTSGYNVFLGSRAGYSNTTGSHNAFVGGDLPGGGNTTGFANSFIGSQAGFANTTGTYNTIVGAFADFGANNLTNATAIGANAFVTQSDSLVLGSINGINNAFSDTRVGIGTTAPQQKLHVDGDSEILSSGTGAGFKFRDRGSTSFSDDWVWYSNGNIARFFRPGIGDMLTVTTGGLLAVNNLGAAGATAVCRNASNQISTCSSSLRYKSNISNFSQGMSFVHQLRPISFEWKDSGMKDIGFGAEDIAKIDPRFVTYNDKGEVEGVKYDRLSVAFVNAFKEQQGQIETLEKRNFTQQKQIETLTQALCSLSPGLKVCGREK